jgi:hypothetical protein
MLDALLLSLPKSSQEFFAVGCVETDLFDFGSLAAFKSWTHRVKWC